MMGPEASGSDFDAELEVLAAELLHESLPSLRKLRSPRYERWLRHSECLLAERRYPPAREDPVAQDLAWQRWQQWKARQQYAGIVWDKAELLEQMLRNLPKILGARMRPTQVLFPGGSTERVEKLYDSDPATQQVNRTLTGALVAYLEERVLADGVAARLDVLEVGAGTGCTTAAVLSGLERAAGAPVAYCYTDISNAFLGCGRRRLARSHPELSFRLFDLERAPQEQQIRAASFDVVIAANVLHATSDVRRALGHLRTVLRDGGVLLMSELKRTSLFLHLTFGLLDGWDLYRDEELRMPGGPALSAPTWLSVLLQGGFHRVEFPRQGNAGSQHTIVARAFRL